jgi:hypothetical protein
MSAFVYLTICLNCSTKLTSRWKVIINLQMIISRHPLACVMYFLSLTEELTNVLICNRSAQFSKVSKAFITNYPSSYMPTPCIDSLTILLFGLSPVKWHSYGTSSWLTCPGSPCLRVAFRCLQWQSWSCLPVMILGCRRLTFSFLHKCSFYDKFRPNKIVIRCRCISLLHSCDVLLYSYHCSKALLKRWRMPSSGMLRRVALVRTDVSEEFSATSIIRVTRIGELGTTLAVKLRLTLFLVRRFLSPWRWWR